MHRIVGTHVRTDVRFSVFQAQTGCDFLGQITDCLILKNIEIITDTTDRNHKTHSHMTLTTNQEHV